MHLAVRTTGTPLDYVPALRRAVAEVDRLVPLEDVRSMDQLLYESVARPRFRATLLAAFGALALALAAARLLRSVLFEVSPMDPATYAAMALFLTAVGLTACALPARRASRTDPTEALRAD